MKGKHFTTRTYVLKDVDETAITDIINGALAEDTETKEYLSNALKNHYNNFGIPTLMDITDAIYNNLQNNLDDMTNDFDTNASKVVKSFSKYITKEMVMKHVKHIDREVYRHIYR